MSIFKKEESFIDEQLKIVEANIKAQRVGTVEYERWLKIRNELIEQKEKEKKKPLNIKGVVTDIIIPIGTTAASIGLSVWLAGQYRDVAKMAYGLDEDFKLNNGKVWNLKDKIANLIPKKL